MAGHSGGGGEFGTLPGRVVTIARHSGRGQNPGQAPIAAEQQAGRDARMPAFTGLTGDLCYAVPPGRRHNAPSDGP